MIDKLSLHIIQALLLSTGVTFSLLSVLKLAQVSTQMKFNAIIKYNFLGMPILLISLLSIFITIFSVNYFDALSSTTQSISGDYCYPDCDNPSSALKFNSDGTFNSSTSALGGMSRWGNWEKVDNDKIKLITTRISTNSNSDKIPPPQTIYIMSNGGLKIGSTIYIKG